MIRSKKICIIENCNRPAASKKMCQNHYWQDYKKNYKPKQNKKDARNKITKTKMGDFFNELKFEIPNKCQCCNSSLESIKSINFTVCLAHILPKSKEEFYIVSTNKKNIVFLCDVCHNGFDNKGKEWFEKQNVNFKNLVKDRVKYLSNFLTEKQEVKIKEYLK